MTARRSTGRAVRIDRTRRLARAIAAVAVAATAVLGLAPAADAVTTPAPTPSPTETGPTGEVGFTLSPIADGVVATGDPLAVSLTVTNDTEEHLPAGRLLLELGSTAITDRATLEAWLGGETSVVSTKRVATASAPDVDPLAVTTEGITVPATDSAIGGRKPGVYPLLARYERGGVELVSTSAMIVPRTAGTTTPVGMIVPITAGELTVGVLTAEQLAVLTAADGALTQQLDAVAGSTAILAVDPAIPAAIRILGESAPASALEWLTRLESLPNSRFALQFGDADVATQLAAGAAVPMQPTSLQTYMTASDFPAATPTPTPTPVATDAPVTEFPDLATLLDIGGGRKDVYWPVEGSADAKTIDKLGTLGTDGRTALTLIPSGSTTSTAAAIPARGSVGKGKAAVLVYDSAISAALREASVTDENVLRGRPLAAATALLALASDSAGDAPLLVTVDRATSRSRVALSAAVHIADQLSTVRPASLLELESTAPTTTAIGTAAADPARVVAASSLFRDEDDLAAFATILDDPTLLTGRERAEILQLLGAAWVGDPAWSQAVADHRSATTSTLGAVSILPPTPVNLATSDASLRYWVRNDLPYPVDLQLYATPDDLRLDVQRVTKIDQATALSNTRVGVPVQARLGNGDVSIELQLRSPSGVEIGAPQYAAVNVRADWEGIGVGIVLALIGAFIALGLVRTIMRRRRLRAEQAAEGGPDAGETEAANPDAAGAFEASEASDPPREGPRA